MNIMNHTVLKQNAIRPFIEFWFPRSGATKTLCQALPSISLSRIEGHELNAYNLLPKSRLGLEAARLSAVVFRV